MTRSRVSSARHLETAGYAAFAGLALWAKPR